MLFRLALIILTLLAFDFTPPVSAQNINTTFRSKINYPGQTLANIWGYTYRGKEYALVGASKGLDIVDISNPDDPKKIVQIPGPDNLWKEIKTYRNYAYVTSEGGGGIQVVNLSGLPSANLQSHFYTGDGPILGQLGAIHALHIDETKGFLYAWGGNLFGGAAKIFDLKQDPYNPVYVGKFDQLGYIHDGYVDNDTMYSCHIGAGFYAIVNMADKSAPELINTQTTPNTFPHNSWLAQDRRTLLTTDERSNSFLAAYDVSDPTDIKFLDKMQGTPGSGSIVHNTYALRNWAISSWYKDGFNIVDITRPDNLVQVGNYDTSPDAGDGFSGCWGVYPFFPSGNIIASNIGAPGELWVITPNYVRACYLEGKVTDGISGLPLNDVQIQVLGSNPLLQELSAGNGTFKTGQEAEGYYTVQISKAGYQPYETSVYLQHGEVITLNVPLYPLGLVQLNGIVTRHDNGMPVENATVWLHGPQGIRSANTDALGAYHFDNLQAGIYDIAASAVGLGHSILSGQVLVTDIVVNLELFAIYRRQGAHDVFSGETLLKVSQNPFNHETLLSVQGPTEDASISFFNSLGQSVQTIPLDGTENSINFGFGFPSGAYTAVLEHNGKILSVKRLIKN